MNERKKERVLEIDKIECRLIQERDADIVGRPKEEPYSTRTSRGEGRCKIRIVRYISKREARTMQLLVYVSRSTVRRTRGVDAVRKQPNKREQANTFDLRSTITPSRRRRRHMGRLVLFPAGCAAVADGCWLYQSTTNGVSSSLAHLCITLLSEDIGRLCT